MIINHNMNALNAHRMMMGNTASSGKSMEKLSSGLRINRAGDDAAGLAISEKMRGQIRGLDQASRNAQDGISMIQTAEGALNETHSILQRMRELSVQASNDTNTSSDRGEIQKEIIQLTSEVNRIGNTTEFNTKKLLNGDMASVISGSTTTTTTKTLSGTYTPNFALGTTWSAGQTGEKPVISDGGGNDNRIDFADFNIDASNDFKWSAMDTSGDNEIKITRSGDTVLVDIKGFDGVDTLTINNDAMAFDEANDKFVYDANGVTFEMTKTEFDKFVDGESLTINLEAYDLDTSGVEDLTAATVGTVSDYTQTLNGGTTLGSMGNVVIDTTDANWIDGVAGIKVTGTGLSGAGSLKIELVDSSNVAIATEEYTTGVASGNITYASHGVSFTYTIGNTDDLTLDMDFDTSTTTSTATTTTDNSAKFQIGANAGQAMSVGISDMRAVNLNVSSGTASSTKTVQDSMGNNITAYYTSTQEVTNGTNNSGTEYALDVSSADKAAAAVKVFDDAVAAVSAERSKLGAFQNRLEHTIANLGTSSENLTAAESRVRDVDMAKEMMTFSKNNILSQAAQAMLAQANQQPQGVLQLLR